MFQNEQVETTAFSYLLYSILHCIDGTRYANPYTFRLWCAYNMVRLQANSDLQIARSSTQADFHHQFRGLHPEVLNTLSQSEIYKT